REKATTSDVCLAREKAEIRSVVPVYDFKVFRKQRTDDGVPGIVTHAVHDENPYPALGALLPGAEEVRNDSDSAPGAVHELLRVRLNEVTYLLVQSVQELTHPVSEARW